MNYFTAQFRLISLFIKELYFTENSFSVFQLHECHIKPILKITFQRFYFNDQLPGDNMLRAFLFQ